MPQYQQVDMGPDPLAQAAGNFGQGFSNRIVQNRRQDTEDDALQEIIQKSKSGVDPLENILSQRNLPFEKKIQLHDAISKVKNNAQNTKAQEKAGAYQTGLDTLDQLDKLLESDDIGPSFLHPLSASGAYAKGAQNRQQFDTLRKSLIGLYGSTLPTGIRNQKEFDAYLHGLPDTSKLNSSNRGAIDALRLLFETGLARERLNANPGMRLSNQGKDELKKIEDMEKRAVEVLKSSSETKEKKPLGDIFKSKK